MGTKSSPTLWGRAREGVPPFLARTCPEVSTEPVEVFTEGKGAKGMVAAFVKRAAFMTLALPLFVLGDLADHSDDPVPPYDLAFIAKPFYRGPDLHNPFSTVPFVICRNHLVMVISI